VKKLQQKIVDYSSTNNTEFDLFLNGLDSRTSDQKSKIIKNTEPKKDRREIKPCTSSSIEKTTLKKSRTLNFDEQLASLDRVPNSSSVKKKDLGVKSKSTSSISVKKINKSNTKLTTNETNKDTPKKKVGKNNF